MDDNLRRWYFEAEDLDGATFCLDQNGAEIDSVEARESPFISPRREADTEASRRSNLWEQQNSGLIAKVTYCSMGKAAEAGAEGERVS